MVSKFSSRRLQPELMDDPSLDADEHRRALTGLRRINWLSRPDAAIWNAIRPLLSSASKEQPLTLLDIASGGGDLAIRMAQRANSEGLHLRILGCDMSETAIQFATEQAKRAAVTNVSFERCNILTDALPQSSFDVVMCSLFLHHLNESDGLTLLKIMRSVARQQVLVDDLRRTALGYWLAWIGCRILTRCRIVHVDGPMSVEGSLTSDEALALARQADMPDARIQFHWPQRYLLSWTKC